MRNPVFVLGSDYNAYGIVRSLATLQVPIVALFDRDARAGFARHSSYCRAYPLSNDESSFRRDLIRHRNEFAEPPVLYASSDRYASLLSRLQPVLSEYFLYHWVPERTVSLIVDKAETTSFCLRSKIRIPRTHIPSPDEDISETASLFKYPCVLKPLRQFDNSFPSGAKNFVASSPAMLIEFYKANPKSRAVWQQCIEGGDECVFTCTAFVRQSGGFGGICGARKLRQYPPGFGNMSFGRSEYVGEIADETLRILDLLNYRGLAEAEFKYDAVTNSYYFIELNARLPAYNSLFDSAGINLAQLAYFDLTHGPKTDPIPAQKNNVYWLYAATDFGSLHRTRKVSPFGFLKWILKVSRSRSYAWFNQRDMAPFLAYANNNLQVALTHFRRLFGWRDVVTNGDKAVSVALPDPPVACHSAIHHSPAEVVHDGAKE